MNFNDLVYKEFRKLQNSSLNRGWTTLRKNNRITGEYIKTILDDLFKSCEVKQGFSLTSNVLWKCAEINIKRNVIQFKFLEFR